MTFILRLPAILVLLALVLVSLSAAFASAVVLWRLPVDLSAALSQAQLEQIATVSALEVGLWAGAGIFFLVSAIRLIRRTRAFWTWLLGFACYGGRWALAQQQIEGGVLAQVRGIDINAYTQPAVLAGTPESAEAQLGLLAVIVIVGLFALIIDAADGSYWNKQSL